MDRQEVKRKRIAFLTSTGIHGLLLIFFLLSMAWRAPDPPLPEFGIELNFGDSPEGSGDVQPETTTASEQQQESEEITEEQVPQQQQEESTPEVVPSTQESVVTEEKKEKPVPEQPQVEEKKEVVPTQKPAETKGNQPVSEGDDKNKTGDKGDPKGVPDPNAAYTGKAGGGAGGDGMVLSMSGWAWADQPKQPSIPDNDPGRIVFEIECDEDGEIIGIKTLERGLSPEAEKILMNEIRRNSLVRTSGGQTPERSKGTITYVVRPR